MVFGERPIRLKHETENFKGNYQLALLIPERVDILPNFLLHQGDGYRKLQVPLAKFAYGSIVGSQRRCIFRESLLIFCSIPVNNV